MVDWARRNPGLALLALALALAIGLYAPSLGAGYVNSDDVWLVRDNAIVQHPSWDNLHTIFFELDPARRFTLAPEYLPVRDLAVTLDFAIWGDWLPGFHLTNLLLYLGAIALWFFALAGFGIDRTVCGLAVLVWAVHPSHAESVAWLAERKGLLGIAFAGLAALAYVRFRAGRVAWLVVAALATVLAVWSKAQAAFAIAALAPLELLLRGPDRRRAWLGLGTLAVVGALAFAPVLVVAARSDVVGISPGGKLALVLGAHGFYTRLATMTIANAYSYPFSQHGPQAVDVIVGLAGLAVALVGLAPRWPRPVRAGAAIWLVGWFPVSHVLLPLQMVLVADRYLLLPSLGFALAVGYGLAHVPRARAIVVAVVVAAAAARTFVAQASWHDAAALWGRAVDANPEDGDAWSMYAEALVEEGAPDAASAVLAEGMQHASSPRLVMHLALDQLKHGDREAGVATMRRAAELGEVQAMSNLALLTNDLAWATRATKLAPLSVHAWRTLGKLSLPRTPAAAEVAFRHALEIEPGNCANRYNLALSLLATDRAAEALPLLEACASDAQLHEAIRAALDEAHRHLRR